MKKNILAIAVSASLISEKLDFSKRKLLIGYSLGVVIVVSLSLPVADLVSIGSIIFLPMAFTVPVLLISPQLFIPVAVCNYFLFRKKLRLTLAVEIFIGVLLIPLAWIQIARFFSTTFFGSLVALELAMVCIAIQLLIMKKIHDDSFLVKRLAAAVSLSLMAFESLRLLLGGSNTISDLVPISIIAPIGVYLAIALRFEVSKLWLRGIQYFLPFLLLLASCWSRSFSVRDGFAWPDSVIEDGLKGATYSVLVTSSALGFLVFALVWELGGRKSLQSRLSN